MRNLILWTAQSLYTSTHRFPELWRILWYDKMSIFLWGQVAQANLLHLWADMQVNDLINASKIMKFYFIIDLFLNKYIQTCYLHSVHFNLSMNIVIIWLTNVLTSIWWRKLTKTYCVNAGHVKLMNCNAYISPSEHNFSRSWQCDPLVAMTCLNTYSVHCISKLQTH